MKIILAISACFALNAFGLDQCPAVAHQINQEYFKDPAFQIALKAAIETQTPIKIKKLNLIKPVFSGESHAGLAPVLIPSGFQLLGIEQDTSQYDISFDYDSAFDNESMLIEVNRSGEIKFSLRSDNWVLCNQGNISQNLVNVHGSIKIKGEKSNKFQFTWDLTKLKAFAPSNELTVLNCNYMRPKIKNDEFWLRGMQILKSQIDQKYFVDFDLGEQGFFSFANCSLKSNSEMNCEGEGLHSAKLSWIGLDPKSPDSVTLEIKGTNSVGVEEVLVSSNTYSCNTSYPINE